MAHSDALISLLPTSSTTASAMPETMKLREAASVPFHFVDCHIANHSPPIVMKAPVQSKMLMSRASIEALLARSNEDDERNERAPSTVATQQT